MSAGFRCHRVGKTIRNLCYSAITYKQTNNVYYFWQPKAELSPYAHASDSALLTIVRVYKLYLLTYKHKKKYIQTCQTLQMLLIIGYSVWHK